MAMKFLKGTAGSKRGLYKLVSRHATLPKMQEVEILPWGGGVGLALRWRGGSATLGLMRNHSARRQGGQLTVSVFGGERGKTVIVPMEELEELGLVEVSEEALPVADKATERSVAVEKTEDQRKPEGFVGHRKLGVQ